MAGRCAVILVAVGLSVCTLVSQVRAGPDACDKGLTNVLVCGNEVFMRILNDAGNELCVWKARVNSSYDAQAAGEAVGKDLDPLCLFPTNGGVIPLCSEESIECGAALYSSSGVIECPDPNNGSSYRVLFGSGNGGGHAAGNGPVVVTEAELKSVNGKPQDEGGGFLCDAGAGPAISTRLANGARILIEIEPNNGEVCVPIPWQTTDGVQMLDTCFPTCDGGINYSLMGADPILARIPLTGLEPCPRLMVPTATNWGLIGLAVVLLVGGTWLLRRRRAFAESLSLL